jgi:hypothetical protein
MSEMKPAPGEAILLSSTRSIARANEPAVTASPVLNR